MGTVPRIQPLTCAALRTSHSALRTVVLLLSIVCAHAESIDRVVLPSGLTVVIAEQHTTQVVEVRVSVRAGPVHEGERLGSGLSLLTQRLIASGGAGALGAGQTREAFARLGDQGTSATLIARSDFACTTTAVNLAPVLNLLASRLITPVFGAEDLERERAAMVAAESSPEQAALMGLLFRQHPARLPVAGLAPLRGALTLEQIQAYHGARYRSANTVVVVCGNVAAIEARRQVEQAFASYPLGGYAPQPLPIEPPPLVPRYQTLTSAAVKQPKITIAWRTEMLDHPAQPGLAVLAAWLGGEHGVIATVLGAKGLGQDSVVENITASSIPGYLQLSFSTTSERRAEAEQALYKGLEMLGQNALEDAPIVAARSAALRQLAQRQSTVHGLTDELLAWELAAGDPAYVRRFAEQIAEVDAVEVLRVLRRYVQSREGDRGRCTVVVRPLDPQGRARARRGETPDSRVSGRTGRHGAGTRYPTGVAAIVGTTPGARACGAGWRCSGRGSFPTRCDRAARVVAGTGHRDPHSGRHRSLAEWARHAAHRVGDAASPGPGRELFPCRCTGCHDPFTRLPEQSRVAAR